MKLQVLDFFSNKPKEDIELDDNIFNVEVRKDILARVVKWQLAKARSGNHKAKGRSEVNHTTRKPFKQKGTGQARQGMKGVAQMRGGGVVFGPVVRSHEHKLPKKVRQIGLKSAISSKIKDSKFLVVDNLNCDSVKTSAITENLKNMNLSNVLFVISNKIDNNNFGLSIQNLYKIDVLPAIGLNVVDILKHNTLVVTKDGIKDVMERLNG
ncbi:50S ribosomal protein L4 [Rickettsiales bacterium LUAb2]